MDLHASPSEIVQTLAAAAGALFSLYGLWYSTRLAVWLRREGLNGQRLFWTLSRVRQEMLRLVGQTVLLSAGIASLFLEPPDIQTGLTLQGQVRVWALLSVTVIFAAKTAFDILDRQRLEDYPWDGVERRIFGLPPRK